MIQDFKDSIKTLNLQIYIDVVYKIIDVYFTLDLDNINLRSDKKAVDILELF